MSFPVVDLGRNVVFDQCFANLVAPYLRRMSRGNPMNFEVGPGFGAFEVPPFDLGQ